MRFLVLGGNGYLGSKIVNELAEKKHRIIATKRVNSNTNRVKAKNILWIPAQTDAVKTAMLYEPEPFDWVLNLACNYGNSNMLYDDCIAANFQFPLEILNLAVGFGVRNYLTIGTSLPDEFNMYALSKNMLSKFGEFYADKHNINFVSLKLEMFYGSDEPMDRFLPSLIRKCRNNEILNVTIGTQHRDIIAIQDVVRAILFTIEYGIKGYNEIPVGTGEAPSIREIVEFIHDVTQSQSHICFGSVPMRANEPDCVADITKLKAMGFVCQHSWKAGLQKMIQDIAE